MPKLAHRRKFKDWIATLFWRALALLFFVIVFNLSDFVLFHFEVNSLAARLSLAVVIAYFSLVSVITWRVDPKGLRIHEVFSTSVKRTWVPFFFMLLTASGMGADLSYNCPHVASIQEYQNICMDKNLDISRNYERRFQPALRGHKYPMDLYTEGKKDEAFAQSQRTCEMVNDICAFYVREMPDHPQMFQLLELGEKSCRSSHRDLWGINNCNVLGAYYFSRENKTKALELWNYACEKNSADACRLILGSHLTAAADRLAKQIQFCLNEPKDLLSRNIYFKVCNSSAHEVLSSVLVKNSEELLVSFLADQKRMPQTPK